MSKINEVLSANYFSGLPKNALVLLAERCVWWTQQFTTKDHRGLKSVAELSARIKEALHVDGKDAYESFGHPNDGLYDSAEFANRRVKVYELPNKGIAAEELTHLVDTALSNIYNHVHAEYVKSNASMHYELVNREELGYYPSLNEKARLSANKTKSKAFAEIRQDLELLKIVAKIENWDDNHSIPNGFFDKYSNLLTTYEPTPGDLVQVKQALDAELIRYIAKHPNTLHNIKPRQFEELIAEILSSFGWEVQLTPCVKDGGLDIFAISKDIPTGVKTSWIIECKKWAPGNKVDVGIIRGLYGVKPVLEHGANIMLATTSEFTKDAREYGASRYNLELRDYENILEWINVYRPNPNGRLYLRDNKIVVPRESHKPF